MPAKTYSAGTIFLQVVPVFGDTMRAITREAKDMNRALGDEMEKGGKEAGERAGKAMGEGMAKEAKKSGDKAATDYAGAFQEKLKSSLRGAQREIDTLNFDTLSDDSEKVVKRIGKLFSELDAEITPTMDDKKVRAKAQFLVADIKKLIETADPKIAVEHNLEEVLGKALAVSKAIDKEYDKKRVMEIETKISDRDLGAFEKKIRETAKRSAKALGDSMDPAVRKLKARLESIADAEIGIDMSADQARAEIISIDQALSRLPSEVNIDVGANTAVAHADLLAFRRAANALDGKDITLPVEIKGVARAVAQTAALTAGVGALKGAFAAGEGGAEAAANSFRSFNFAILGAVTLLPAMIPMIGALGGGLLALLPILGAVGAGIAAMVIGFSGIGDAVGALGDVKDNAAKDAQAAGQTMAAASHAVADAERALADARRNAAEAAQDAARAVADAREAAADAIEDAIERQKDAQEEYRDALKDVVQAEKDLAQARKDAKYELLDLDNAVTQNDIDTGQAVISVFEAQANYDATMSDGSATNQDKDAALLALREAELQLLELRQEQERLAEEKAKADKDGIEGTEGVTSAQEALTQAVKDQQEAEEDLAEAAENAAEVRRDAAESIADAERNLARVRADGARAIADAERNLARARESQGQAAQQAADIGSASMQKLEQAMDKLGPTGRKFARFIHSLRGDFYRLRDAVQVALLPPVQRAMQKIMGTYGPQFQSFMASMGGVVGGLFETLADRMATSPAWRKFFGMIERLGPLFLENFGLTMINFMEGFASLMTIIAPFAERLSFALLDISEHFAAWMASSEGSDYWTRFMEYAASVGPQVVAFFVELWNAVVNLAAALAPWGLMVMNALTQVLAFIGAMDTSTLSLFAGAILSLVIAFQAAVGVVALAWAGAAVFATTAGATVFFVILLVGALAAAYHEFESVRDIVHATTGFISDHREMLIKVTSAIFAAIAAYKAFKAIMATARAVMIGYAAAGYGAAGATYAQSTAQKVGFVAGKIYYGAMRVWTVLTNLMTLANLKLAASFLLNPVVLIVVAIIALIAVLVILYKKNETFRKIVDKVWGALKSAAVTVWDAIKKAFWAGVEAVQAAWEWLKPVFSAIGQVLSWLWTAVKFYLGLVISYWTSVFKAMVWVVTNILWPIIDLLITVIVKFWKNVIKVYLGLVLAFWKKVFQGMKWVWENILWPVIKAIGNRIKDLWEKYGKPAIRDLKAAWDKLGRAWDKVYEDYIKPAIGAFKGALGELKTKVDTVVGFIKSAWEKLQQVFAKPIVFIVDTILNGGLIAGFNKVAKFVGSTEMEDIPLSQGIRNAADGKFATGGVLPGYTPGQDVHHFKSPTGGNLHLSGGEAIMRPEFTSVVGSGWVDHMNMIARAGGRSGVKRALGGQRYASGGVFFPLPGGYIEKTPYNMGHDGVDINHPNDASGKVPFFSATSGTVNYVGYNRGYGNAVFVNSPYGELVYGHGKDGTHGVSAGSKVSPGTFLAMVGATQGSTPVTGPHLHFGYPNGTYAAAMNLLSGAKHGAGGSVNPLAAFPDWLIKIARGPMDYVKGLVDGPIDAMRDKFGKNQFVQALADTPGELLGGLKTKLVRSLPTPLRVLAGDDSGARGQTQTGADVAAASRMDVAAYRGGILPYNGTMKYDSGGYLPPGLTSVVNMTGRPEPVFTADQFDGMGGGGETFHYEPHFEGSDLTPGEVVRDMDHARRKMRREGRYARNR